MRTVAIVLSASIVLGSARVAAAQSSTPAPAPAAPTFHYPGEPDPRAADPGVAFVTVMDRPEVRILRVQVQPGGARRTHTHDDVAFHLLIPVNGSLEVTMAGSVVQAQPAQAFFMKAGTPHSFTNKGTSPVSVMEVFVKPPPKAAQAPAAH